MARSLWTGAISFGLINIPVSLVSSKEPMEIRFHLLDKRDQSRIGYKSYNKTTGQEVERDEVVKAYEYSKNQFVVVTEKDFEAANPKATQSIDIEDFVELDDIPITYYEKPYYLIPQKGGEKGYELLRRVMEEMKMVAVGRIVLHKKQRLVAIMPDSDVLLLEVLRFQHEIASPRDVRPELSDKTHRNISKREVEMAEKLVEGMATKWQPEKYKDTYRDDILKMIERKIKTGHAVAGRAPQPGRPNSNVSDLMPLLRKSLEARAKKGRTHARSSRTRDAHAAH